MIQAGSKVKYSAKFLRSVGIYSGDIPFARGTVRQLEPLSKETTLAVIDWNAPGVPERVNVANLIEVGKAYLEPA